MNTKNVNENAYTKQRENTNLLKQSTSCILGLFVFIALFIVSRYNYLFFHTIAELISIIVAWSVFLLVWNAKRYIQNDALIFLGISYLFIGGIDLVHTISYKGMGILGAGHGANTATQLWIAARYIESISLCIFPFLFYKNIRFHYIFLVYFLVSVLSFFSIFSWNVFPTCFVEDAGLTFFKKFSEYVICMILITAFFFLRQHRSKLETDVYYLMVISIFLTILEELAFTFYVSVYDLSNLAGHYLKILSFFCIYKAIIETGVKKPNELLFRNLVQSEKEYRSTLNNLQIGVVVHAPDTSIIFSNPMASKIIGLTFEQMTGKKSDDNAWCFLYENETRMKIEDYPINKVFLTKKPINNYIVGIYRPDKENITWVVANAIPIFTDQNEIEKGIVNFADITDLKNAENIKSEFLSNMSHEIRTPINAIHLFSKILKDQNLGHLNKKQDEYVDNIIDSTNRLLFLINDILDISRVSSGKLEITPVIFSLNRLVERLRKTIVLLSNKTDVSTQIQVSSDVPDTMLGDELRIEQILKNLISNAIKFTDKGIIEVVIETHSSDEILFKVNDTGTGIPAYQQKDIFEKFFQADSSYAKKYAGSGLGLAISKELVELMDGKIWFESEVGKGSTFYVTLKLNTADKPYRNNYQKKLIPNTIKGFKKRFKILFAEDDELNRESMSYYLKKEGHQVIHANNGRAALKVLDSENIDIILMDVQMPEMDGIEATRQIRASTSGKFNPQLPIIALTAYAMDGDQERFLEAGMHDYVSKPVNIDLLLEKIRSLCLLRT